MEIVYAQRCRRRARWLSPCVLILGALLMAFAPAAWGTGFVWTGARDGNWSTVFLFVTNWQGSVVPVSSASTALEFSSSLTTTTVTNDIASPFVLNNLTFNGAPFTLTGGTLEFAFGATPATIVIGTSSAQTINNALTLDNPLTISGSGGTTLTFHGAIGGAGSLSDSVPTVLGGGSVSLGVSQAYYAPVTLAVPTTLTSTGNANITVGSQINGAQPLTINTGGVTTFSGPVGNSAPIISLTTNAGGSTTLSGGSVTTLGVQAYNDAVTLGSSMTLTGGGNITFASTLNGGTLTLNTTGTGTFAGAVGGTTPLTSLVTNAGGTTAINGGSVSTSGAQTYNDAVTLGPNTTLTASAGSVTFAQTLNGPGSLTVNSSQTTRFGGVVGGTTSLNSLTTDAPGSTQLNGGIVTTLGPQSFNDAITLGANTTLTSTSAGNILLANTVNGPLSLTINTAGTTTFGGAVGAGTALTSLTTDAPGTTDLNAGSVTTTGAQAYNDPVALGANTTLTSTGSGNISFASTISGAFGLTVNTAGTTTLGGIVGPIGGTLLAGLKTDAAGSTAINGGLVGTVGAQSYGDAVTLGANTGLSSTGGGDLSFGSTINGPFALTLSTAGNVVLSGAVGNSIALTSFTANPGASNVLNGGSITTTGAQSLSGSIFLGANTTLTSTGSGNITLGNVNGAFALTINTAGTTTLNGGLGAGAALSSLTTDAAGTTAMNGSVIKTTGAQTYNDAVTLAAPTTLTSTGSGNISLSGIVNGAFNLTINTAGTTTFGAFMGGTTPLASITTDAAGTTVLGGGASTTGSQTYNDPVTLSSNVSLSSIGGDIAFASTVNGTFDLNITAAAGTVTFNGAVGGTAKPTAFNVTTKSATGGAVTASSITGAFGSGATTFTGPLHATNGSISLSGDQFLLAGLQSDTAGIAITNAGAASVTGPIAGPVDFTKAGAGTLTLSGANTYTGVTTVISGTLKVTSTIAASAQVAVDNHGTFEAAVGQTVKNLAINDGGKVVVSADALKIGVNLPGNHLNIVTAPAGFAVLDLTTHGLIIDSAPAEAETARDSIRSLIINAFSGGTWLGSGITSSNAQSDTTKGVGYALSSEILGPAGGTFLNVPTDGTGAVARYTFLGDANLDGAVGFPDLVKLAQNYNIVDGSRLWFTGDFNYDGNVDFADLVKLAQNYNAALPGESIPGARPGFESDLRAAFAAVPEPLSPACLATAWVLMPGRRRAGAHTRRSHRT